MAYKVEILPAAWEDLKRIEDWYSVQFDVETALKVSDHILDAIERLESFPDSGSLTPDEWLNQQGYRMVICGKHAAIYKQIEKTVYVYHIADTQTEYTKLFY
ncbi:MAG: type II toxin-antitoxin system RelE/ParE family toxin [Roseburia sp.]|nr:type II toxin-antitoxin system RelE/ParE family toxin [Roseburia sp.]